MLRVTILSAVALLGACAGGANFDYANNQRPPESVTGDFYTTAGGCTYARGKTNWHIVANPVRLNLPANPPNCPPVL